MAVTMYKFHCSNGHTFEANAKLRTRCPECGVSTKRSFEAVESSVQPHKAKPTTILDSEDNSTDKTESEPVKSKSNVVLVRQGRPRVPVKKPDTTAKKPVPSKINGSSVRSNKVSAGLVKSHTINRKGITPNVSKRPVKTAVARGIKSGREVVPPYWHKVADKFGF